MSPKMGRPTIFRPKDGGRINGFLSHAGRAAWEHCREQLRRRAARYGLQLGSVSDGDVAESLARGTGPTRIEVMERRKEQSDAS